MNLFNWIYLSYLYLGNSFYALIIFIILLIVIIIVGMLMRPYQKKLHAGSGDINWDNLDRTELVNYKNLCAIMIMSCAGFLCLMLFAMQSNFGGQSQRGEPLLVELFQQDQHLNAQMQNIQHQIRSTHSKFYQQQLQKFYDHDQQVLQNNQQTIQNMQTENRVN